MHDPKLLVLRCIVMGQQTNFELWKFWGWYVYVRFTFCMHAWLFVLCWSAKPRYSFQNKKPFQKHYETGVCIKHRTSNDFTLNMIKARKNLFVKQPEAFLKIRLAHVLVKTFFAGARSWSGQSLMHWNDIKKMQNPFIFSTIISQEIDI